MTIALAAVLFGLDLVSTLVGIRIAGPEGETNPLYRAVIVRFGRLGFAAVYAVIAATLVVVGARTGTLLSIAAVLAIVVVNNVFQILRWWRSQRRRRAAIG
jgi:hypothetical protein